MPPFFTHQIPIKHIMDQRALAAAADAGDAAEHAQRNGDIELLQVVLVRAHDLDRIRRLRLRGVWNGTGIALRPNR